MRAAVYRVQLFKPSEPFIAAQIAALPKAADAVLIGRKLFGPPDPRISYWHPPLHGTKLLRFVLANDVSEFLPWLREWAPEIIHAHFAIDALYALELARRLNVPLITTLHGFDVTTRSTRLLLSGKPALMRYAILQRNLLSDGTLFLGVSDFMVRQALNAGFPPERVIKHSIGIDPNAFTTATHGEHDLRVVHVARLVEKKGTQYLLEAFARVSGKYPRARLILIGDGPLRATLDARARALGVAEQVTFLGAQPHRRVAEELAKAAVLALPSVTAANGDAEGLGLVLLEAAASGVPVIGTHHGGIPEAVIDGETGLLVRERSASELAQVLDRLLADPGLRQQMGAAGRAMVRERFDIHSQSARLAEIYRSLLGQSTVAAQPPSRRIA